MRSAPDLTRFVPVAPDEALGAASRYLVCYLGVMGPQDGVDYALRALASMRDDLGRDDVHAVFVGHGDAWDDLVALAHELGLEDRVEFTGRVSDEDVVRYLSTADVCLAPDPKNPLNDVSTMNKIVEYMAMSQPARLLRPDRGARLGRRRRASTRRRTTSASSPGSSSSCSTTPSAARAWARSAGSGSSESSRGSTPAASCSRPTRRCWAMARPCAAPPQPDPSRRSLTAQARRAVQARGAYRVG